MPAVIKFHGYVPFECPNDPVGKLQYYKQVNGLSYEKIVFHLLQEKWRYESASIHFWRTKDMAEVDFVINIGKTVLPVEVKCRELKEETVSRPLRNFIAYKLQSSVELRIEAYTKSSIIQLKGIEYFIKSQLAL